MIDCSQTATSSTKPQKGLAKRVLRKEKCLKGKKKREKTKHEKKKKKKRNKNIGYGLRV